MTVVHQIHVLEPDTMTLDELRTRLQIGQTKALELARADAFPIPTLRVGRHYRFSRRAFQQWLGAGAAERPHDAA